MATEGCNFILWLLLCKLSAPYLTGEVAHCCFSFSLGLKFAKLNTLGLHRSFGNCSNLGVWREGGVGVGVSLALTNALRVPCRNHNGNLVS